jgi:hypothetical protein
VYGTTTLNSWHTTKAAASKVAFPPTIPAKILARLIELPKRLIELPNQEIELPNRIAKTNCQNEMPNRFA